MAERKCLGVLISDFNLANLAGYLGNDTEAPEIAVSIAPFGQPVQALLQDDLECWQENPDFAVVWTQPEAVIESFNQLLSYREIEPDRILKEVDDFAALLSAAAARVKWLFVPTWTMPSNHPGFGMLDMRPGTGIAQTLMRMNLRLAEKVENASNIYLLDAGRWMGAAGKHAFNPKLWYMAKIPFANEVFIEAVKDLKCALRGANGSAKKLIIVDLDDTLWGGIVGDAGWENLRLGGHDFLGEAFVDFQREIKAMTHRGILLGIVSKNEESVALEAIAKHPEMVLHLDDIAGWKINWRDKALNVLELVAELNLGLQSVVFIDDNPVERARVREALPEVLVPDWPLDKTLYKSALLGLRCFDNPSISQEDVERTQMYVSERQREASRQDITSLDDWLKSLNVTIHVEELNDGNLQRTVQLMNKTNQLNLATRRTTDAELRAWVDTPKRKLWTFRVADKFGDSGLTGIISVEADGKIAQIADFVLSCRVMGRKVEDTMFRTAIDHCRSLGVGEVRATYVPSAKNKPCLDIFESSRFVNNGNNTFTWRVDDEYSITDHIKVEHSAGYDDA